MTTPDDSVIQVHDNVRFNCTVEGMTNQDNLIWWFHSRHTNTYTKLFESNPSSRQYSPLSDVRKRIEVDVHAVDFEIIGSYDIVVRNALVQHSGRYICELVNLQNYTAELTVVGE